jgi:hypothetical protein
MQASSDSDVTARHYNVWGLNHVTLNFNKNFYGFSILGFSKIFLPFFRREITVLR